MLQSELMAAFFGLRFCLFRQTGNDVHLCTQNAVEQHIRAHVLFIRLNVGIQIQNRLHSNAAAGGHGLHGVVRLRCAVSKDCVASLFLRIANQVFQFAYLVSAKQAHARKIVPLDIELHAELLAQPFELIQRRREEAQLGTRLFFKQRMESFCLVHLVFSPSYRKNRVFPSNEASVTD